MFKEDNILKIVAEDILRLLGEVKGEILLKSMRAGVKVRSSLISEAVKNLEKEGLIRQVGENVSLTREGRIRAKNILKKHLVLEEYFKKLRGRKEAHQIAHILEHYISEEVIKNIREISTLKEGSISLTKFKRENGLIADIVLGLGLFERVISMGIFPGEEIEIVKKIPNGVVIKVRDKKIVLDKNIAREIKVLDYEKS
jgi:Mn-dependent DtxR family transcriptional regulator